MAVFICMDGLGGLPEVTFGLLQQALELKYHRVVLADIEDINTHEDRIQRVLHTYYAERLAITRSLFGADEPIFLVGQSAGGGAVREVAARLKDDSMLSGIILLSQSMPLFYSYMTPQLFDVMKWRMGDIILGRDMHTTLDEFIPLIEPVAESLRSNILNSRQVIPGREARRLAFCPPRLKAFSCRALVIYGEKDQWINPSAHRKLADALGSGRRVTICEIPGAGHLTLASDRRGEVLKIIMDWVDRSE